MCEAIGHTVIALHRSKIGDLTVKDLKIGEWRYLRKEEVKKIKNYVYLTKGQTKKNNSLKNL